MVAVPTDVVATVDGVEVSVSEANISFERRCESRDCRMRRPSKDVEPCAANDRPYDDDVVSL